MEVPFFDLTRQNAEINEELNTAMQAVLNSGQFLNGSFLSQFEKEWSEYLGVKYVVGVGNGTDAIYLTLKALGIGSGDEVITTSVSWISTASAIVGSGADVVFADVDEKGLIDLDQIERLVTSKTRALLVVHLYGQMVDVKRAKELCENLGLLFIEDAAQAHGATFENLSPGEISDAATFSFYPTKNLGALGDAGAVVTQSEELALEVRKLANQGGLSKYEISRLGVTSRMDELQAAVLSVKLKRLVDWNERRIEISQFYESSLSSLRKISLPKSDSRTNHVFHQYVIHTSDRDELKGHLLSNGVHTDIHYPTALPMYPMFRNEGARTNDCSRADKFCLEGLSLPIFPELKEEELAYVCECVSEYFKKI